MPVVSDTTLDGVYFQKLNCLFYVDIRGKPELVERIKRTSEFGLKEIFLSYLERWH